MRTRFLERCGKSTENEINAKAGNYAEPLLSVASILSTASALGMVAEPPTPVTVTPAAIAANFALRSKGHPCNVA
jgi:hypothetical protein